MIKNFIPEASYSTEFKLSIVSLLLAYFVSFYVLVGSLGTSIDHAVFRGCWSYLPNCEDFYFLQAMPFGYSQNIFYAGIFLIFLLIIEGLLKNKWKQVWWLLLALFSWKIFTLFVIGATPGSFDYYDVVFSIVILFLPYKAWFLRLTFVWLYFLASTIKIHSGWILGTYFTSLQTGLAIFGDTLAPFATLMVTLMQIVGAWFLLSSNPTRRTAAFIFFFAFHLYSIVYVGWRYPTSDLLMLSVLFYLYKNPSPVPINKKSIFGYVFLLLLLMMQFIPKLIPGDQKFTLEGNNLGLYMFEANHQCISTLVMTDPQSGEVVNNDVAFNVRAQKRCSPAIFLQHIKKTCKLNPDIKVNWTLDHSINGGPFYRMINEPDACNLNYKTFQKNDWIKYKFDEMEIVGYPLKNYY